MFCPNCGQENDANAYQCAKCGQVLQRTEQTYTRPAIGGDVPNYLVWAILSTLFCCWPLGIVSIVYAAKVNGLLTSGDYTGAVNASDNAKKWAKIAAGAGIAVWVIYIIFYVGIVVCASSVD